ncbi:unnamed protein product, partial [Nesidiocoris tenuis]
MNLLPSWSPTPPGYASATASGFANGTRPCRTIGVHVSVPWAFLNSNIDEFVKGERTQKIITLHLWQHPLSQYSQ